MLRMSFTSLLVCVHLLSFSGNALAYYPNQSSGGKDVRNLQNRLNRATDNQGQIVKGLAQTVICKKDKKPVCYAAKVVYESDYALVHVTRPGVNDYFVLLKNTNGSWKARYAKSFKRLKLAYWRTDRAPVPEPVAKKLIAKLLG